MKHVNFVPKDSQRILSSRKIIMNRKCSTRKLFLKISQYSQENTCVEISFLIKMQAFRASALLKRDSKADVFCEHWEIFKNTYFEEHCARLLLKFSLELFPIWVNNIGSEEDVFSKIKQNKNRSKIQLDEKNLPFHDVFYHFVFLFFSTSHQTPFVLHNKKTVLK